MRLAIAALAAVLATGAAQAQQVVDGSEAKLDKATFTSALEILEAKYKSTGEFQLRALRPGNQATAVCGELALKAGEGGFQGFGRFGVDTRQKAVELFYPKTNGDGVATAELQQGSLKALNDIREMCPDA